MYQVWRQETPTCCKHRNSESGFRYHLETLKKIGRTNSSGSFWNLAVSLEDLLNVIMGFLGPYASSHFLKMQIAEKQRSFLVRRNASQRIGV